jgi:hypothetical protein
MVQVEEQIVVSRLQKQMASDASLLQMAISSILDKKAGENFRKTVNLLNGS